MNKPGRLPIVPDPFRGEALSSWLARLAARYDLRANDILHHVGVGQSAYRDLDWLMVPHVDRALAQATGISTSRIAGMRYGVEDGWLWDRPGRAWCRACLQADLLTGEESWERRSWRSGATVLCNQHRQLLEETCPVCHQIGTGCLFRAYRGRIRSRCIVRDRPVALRNDETLSVLPLGLRLTGITVKAIDALQRDLHRSLRGHMPHGRWCGVTHPRDLPVLVEDFLRMVVPTLGLQLQVAPPLRWMLRHSDWQDLFVFTPAMLPLEVAAGILAIAALILADPGWTGALAGQIDWAPAGRGKKREAFSPESFLQWLHPGIADWGRCRLEALVMRNRIKGTFSH